MKKLLLLTSALIVLGAGVASAAAPGTNLGWSNCNTASNANRLFTCDNNGTSQVLIGSFVIGFDVADFVAVSAALDITTSGGLTPPWFQFGPGGCREGSLSLTSVGAIAGCVNPYSGANQGGGYVVEASPSPDRFRVRFDWARDLPGAIVANTLYTGFSLGMDTAQSFDEGFGVCVGCNVPACAVLNSLEVYSFTNDRVAIIEGPDARNFATWQGGTGDCPGATPSKSSTWGAVKALYR